MAKTGYTVTTGGAVALSAGTAKTVLGVKSGAAFCLDVLGFEIGFDGVTASAVPVLVEFCASTWATNSPGTNSTSVTPAQSYGRVAAAGFTAAKTWTAEPTALTVLKEFLLTPNGGLVAYRWPLGNTPDCALAEGFAVRCTAPAAVNVRVSLDSERA
jgi:hypothetical protein